MRRRSSCEQGDQHGVIPHVSLGFVDQPTDGPADRLPRPSSSRPLLASVYLD